MALANVALTDTFDYWRTITNSLVVAINDKLFYANSPNTSIVSISPFASRSSNLTVTILTSSSVSDTATSNVPSSLAVNTVNELARSYVTAANNWSNTLVLSANAWSNAVGLSGNSWSNTVGTAGNTYLSILSANNAAGGNTWANTVGTAANNYAAVTYAPKISPTFTGTVTFNANVASQTLSDGATINWDTSLGTVATVTLGGNRTLAAPTNLKVGTYILHVYQDATGSRTITWNSIFKWPAGIAPVLTTTGSRHDMFSFVSDGTNLYGSYMPDVR